MLNNLVIITMGIVQKIVKSFSKKSVNPGNGGQAENFFSLNTGYSFNQKTDDTFINEGYLSNTDVYAIINKIAKSASVVPIKVYEKTKDGLVEAPESDLAKLLSTPNTGQTEEEFRTEWCSYLMLTGDTFINSVKLEFLGNITGKLSVLAPQDTELIVSLQTNKVIGYRVTTNGQSIEIPLEDVWHSKYFNPNTQGNNALRGLSPLQAAYRSLDASNELITAEASFYKNKGISGVLGSDATDSSLVMSADEAETLDKSLKKRIGGSNRTNGVIVTSAKVKYVPMGMSPSDLDMIKSGDVKLRNLCRVYSVDSKLFGDAKASTYNNVTEVNKQYYTDAVIPLNNKYVAAINKQVAPDFSKKEGKEYVVEQDTTSIEALQSNQKEEAEKNKTQSEGITGILTSSISEEAKSLMLVNIYGISEEDSEILSKPTEQQNDG